MSVGTTSGKFVPSKAHSFSVDDSSSIPSTTLTSHIPIPHISEQVHFQPSLISEPVHYEPLHFFEQVHFLPLISPQTTNPNVTIPSPTPTQSEILTYILIPTPQQYFPLSFLSQLTHSEPLNSEAPIIEPKIGYDTESDVDFIPSQTKHLNPTLTRHPFKLTFTLSLWMNYFSSLKARLLSNWTLSPRFALLTQTFLKCVL